ncbi:hypothetical protein HanIR_Chr10g0455611 [Helianthus annuus]|nr:hypothetical protein HanIR_Chr10g0455611 [Helianthus annuus]
MQCIIRNHSSSDGLGFNPNQQVVVEVNIEENKSQSVKPACQWTDSNQGQR